MNGNGIKQLAYKSIIFDDKHDIIQIADRFINLGDSSGGN